MPQGLNIESYYRNAFKETGSSFAIATLRTLIEFLKRDESSTVAELRKNVRDAIEKLKSIEPVVVVESVAEIFFRFITLGVSNYEHFKDIKEALIRRSNIFIEKRVVNSRKRVARFAHTFIEDGTARRPTKILVHSKSQTVLETLREAFKLGKHIKVYVTESAPNYEGRLMNEILQKEGIESQVIIDASVGFYIEEIDLVMTGAEGVTESGGIINKIGTFPVAVLTKTYNKPLYVLAESYKFLRIYPLNQNDIPDRFKYRKSNPEVTDESSVDLKPRQVFVDYTPPQFISLLLTDVGPLTTAAVSDELMKLYL